MKNDTISEQDKKYLNGKPTRIEVANYVNGLLDKYYMPHLQQQMQLSIMIIQGILLKKGICTPQDIKEITEEFIKEAQQRNNANEKPVDVIQAIESIIYNPNTPQGINSLLTKIKNINKTSSLDEINSLIRAITNLQVPPDSDLFKLKPSILDHLNQFKKKLLN